MKFRVWDKKDKLFKGSFLIDQGGNLLSIHFLLPEIALKNKKDKEFENQGNKCIPKLIKADKTRHEVSYKIEEVQDINENDVYEGDYYLYNNGCSDSYIECVEQFYDCPIFYVFDSCCEIIGNKYQNTIEELKQKYGVK